MRKCLKKNNLQIHKEYRVMSLNLKLLNECIPLFGKQCILLFAVHLVHLCSVSRSA